MTTITLPRAVVEQALEALIIAWQQQPRWQITESMHNLRAAPPQQAWVCPESPEHRYAKPGHCEDCGRTLVRAQQAEHFCDTHCTWADHAAGCVRAEPVQEPVAIADGTFNHDCPIGTLLYTAPPRQKPLTQEEIPALAEQVLKPSVYCDAEALLGTDGLVALVRAVEAKHGIKG